MATTLNEEKKYANQESIDQALQQLKNQQAVKPGQYQSPWQSQISDMMDKILNREKFSYDLNGDALYQQYKDQAVVQGQQAMMDTMGQAQAMTGGYGNSYAQTAGQQAYQGHLQQLNDKIPELYSLALSQYNQEGQNMLNQYGLMQDQENQAYGRHQDSVSSWQSEYDRLMGEYNTERNFGYQQDRDQAKDAQWQAEFDEAVRQYNHKNGIVTGTAGGTASTGSTGGTGGGGGTRGYDNGGLEESKIREMQAYYGTSADGKWGSQSSKAADGLSAQAAWDKYQAETGGGKTELSAAGNKFLSQLPYVPAGGNTEAWKNLVDSRLETAFNNGTVTAKDVEIIVQRLGIK